MQPPRQHVGPCENMRPEITGKKWVLHLLYSAAGRQLNPNPYPLPNPKPKRNPKSSSKIDLG